MDIDSVIPDDSLSNEASGYEGVNDTSESQPSSSSASGKDDVRMSIAMNAMKKPSMTIP